MNNGILHAFIALYFHEIYESYFSIDVDLKIHRNNFNFEFTEYIEFTGFFILKILSFI